MRRALLSLGLLVALLLVAACAPGPNELAHVPGQGGHVAGFWLGLWHGLIAPVTFVISLFRESVNVYEVHNSGGWYDLGFLLGVSASLGGSAAGSAASRSRRR